MRRTTSCWAKSENFPTATSPWLTLNFDFTTLPTSEAAVHSPAEKQLRLLHMSDFRYSMARSVPYRADQAVNQSAHFGLTGCQSSHSERDIAIAPMTEHDLLEVVEIEEQSGLSRWGWAAYYAELQGANRELMLIAKPSLVDD